MYTVTPGTYSGIPDYEPHIGITSLCDARDLAHSYCKDGGQFTATITNEEDGDWHEDHNARCARDHSCQNRPCD